MKPNNIGEIYNFIVTVRPATFIHLVMHGKLSVKKWSAFVEFPISGSSHYFVQFFSAVVVVV